MAAFLRIFVRPAAREKLLGVATAGKRGHKTRVRLGPGVHGLASRVACSGHVGQAVRAISLAVLLQAALPSEARARDDDPWLGRDKGLHFGISVALGAGGYGAVSPWAQPRWQRALLGGGFALTVGGAKELYDLRAGDPSWRDFTWDIAGSAVGVGIAYLVDLALARPLSGPAR